MTGSLFQSLSAMLALLIWLAQAQDQSLVGTWTTKSKKVITGPGFYDPVADKFIEPALTGISYSFTADGWYEEAYYRAVSNPTTPNCPSVIMQWQHGRYTLPGNGSIIMNPIEVDGRQQTSAPCSYDNSLYQRYVQAELMSSYTVQTDKFHNIPRLDMYQFDGSPVNPMYLEYSPPMMLPTQTLNPTSTATAGSSTATTAGNKLGKRGMGGPLDHDGQDFVKNIHPRPMLPHEHSVNRDTVWWLGLGMLGIGSVVFLGSR